jgi:NAD(P)-dependent dehydrogenase (short-subunit alcohol dehydrogenase family)
MTGTAVVTGAGQGIGRSIALKLAARGRDIALLGRHLDALKSVAAEIEKLGRAALVVHCDVSKSNEVEQARDEVIAAFGAPQVVVNNAGIAHRADVASMLESDWDEVLSVNLKGAFLVTRAFLPSMISRKNGRFIAISSISARGGTARMSAYCASKWGLVGFAKSLAEELRGTGLQSLAVLPGSVDTPMLVGSGFSPDMTPDEVASLVVYAALDAPAAMNGSAIEMFGP